MTEGLRHAFDFSGRLSFSGQLRLERKLLLIALPCVVSPVLLLMASVSPVVAGLPLLVLVPVAVALAAGNFRRLHDVGRHAHRVYAKRLAALAFVAIPLAAVVAFPTMPEMAAWTLFGLTAAAILVSFFVRDVGFTEWRPGDPGPNRFGPPPN